MSNLLGLLKWDLRDRYYYLFISLAALILLPPFLIHLTFLSYLIYFLLSIVIVNCTLIIFDKSARSGLGIIVLLVVILFLWLSIANDWQNTSLQVVRMLLLVVFFGFTLVKMVREIFKMEKVTGRVVVGAVGAYLLLGFIGAFLFEIIELLYPQSFSHLATFSGFYGEIYFSFVTISTLGYGDITPLTPQAQAISIFVAISGQLYLAILMATLVGKFLKDSHNA